MIKRISQPDTKPESSRPRKPLPCAWASMRPELINIIHSSLAALSVPTSFGQAIYTWGEQPDRHNEVLHKQSHRAAGHTSQAAFLLQIDICPCNSAGRVTDS